MRPLADMVKTGQDTRLAEPWWNVTTYLRIHNICIYIYTYVYEPGPGSPLFPSPSSQLHGPPDFTEPFICTLFAAFESHNLVIGPCLAVCLAHTAQDLVMYCYSVPRTWLTTHVLHICYYRLYTESVPMHTILVYAWMQYALTNVYIYIHIFKYIHYLDIMPN